MEMFLVLRLPREIHLCKSSSNISRLPSFWTKLHNPHVRLTFAKGSQTGLRLPQKMPIKCPKVLRHCVFFFEYVAFIIPARDPKQCAVRILKGNCTRSTVQDLYKRSLGKISVRTAWQDLNRSPCNVSVQVPFLKPLCTLSRKVLSARFM